MSVEAQLLDLANVLSGRLDDNIIADIRDYVNHNEYGIAFNILCNQLYEYDVLITQAEWRLIDSLGKSLKHDEMEHDWSFITELIR